MLGPPPQPSEHLLLSVSVAHDEHGMLSLGTQSLRQGAERRWQRVVKGEGLAGVCVIPERMAMDRSHREVGGDNSRKG